MTTDTVIAQIISSSGNFPGNPTLPFLLYKHACLGQSQKQIEKMVQTNGWKNTWVNGIYPYHHFHANTHEALIAVQGSCAVQIGGEKGPIFKFEAGDMMILPAGVSHKNCESTSDFVCVGSYPFALDYDMHYGKAEEIVEVKHKIERVPFPEADPLFGKNGPLFTYWKPALPKSKNL